MQRNKFHMAPLRFLESQRDGRRARGGTVEAQHDGIFGVVVLRAVLPFLDNLERAMGQEGASAAALLSGVRMTHDQFLLELRKFGLEQIPAPGGTFDPSLHEAIASVPASGKPGGTILAEARKGYLLHGRLLRPVQVTVAAAPAEDDGGEAPAETGDRS